MVLCGQIEQESLELILQFKMLSDNLVNTVLTPNGESHKYNMIGRKGVGCGKEVSTFTSLNTIAFHSSVRKRRQLLGS